MIRPDPAVVSLREWAATKQTLLRGAKKIPSLCSEQAVQSHTIIWSLRVKRANPPLLVKRANLYIFLRDRHARDDNFIIAHVVRSEKWKSRTDGTDKIDRMDSILFPFDIIQDFPSSL